MAFIDDCNLAGRSFCQILALVASSLLRGIADNETDGQQRKIPIGQFLSVARGHQKKY